MIRRLIVAALLLAGCSAGAPRNGSEASLGPTFALLGDAPYSQPHANMLDDMIDDINRAKPAFVVHLGDITGGLGPCTDAWFDARKKQFARFASPFVLVLGDNEWTDCHRSGFDPLERLAKVRALFHAESPALPDFARQSITWPEHTRWTFGSTLFVGLNVPGSNNNLGRTAQMDAEHARRMQAVLEWLNAAVTRAAAPRFTALVVLMQANPNFGGTFRLSRAADGYASLRAALEQGARQLGKPFIVAHGDTHRFKHDRPVAGAPNLLRIEVDGWPQLGWLKVRMTPGTTEPVAIERLLWH